MRRYRWLAAILYVIGCTPQSGVPGRGFENGRWFNGSEFERKTLYVVGSELTTDRPSLITETIDLEDRFVIPPLAEAHIHDLNRSANLDERIALYLSKGIYYVLVQGAMFEITPDMLSKVNRPSSVDVAYVFRTVLTSWSQVVHELILPLAGEGLFGDRRTIEELDGRSFFVVDSQEDLEAKWSAIEADSSRYLKVRIAFSEQFATRRNDGRPLAVDPQLVPEIVARGKAAGRPVSAHIETRADFRLAAQAGVDMVTHLPGWQIGKAAGYPDGNVDAWMLTEADARLAAENDVVVVTTSLPKLFLPDAEANEPLFRALHRHNLEILWRHGVTIAIGSDNQENLVPHEIGRLADLGVFDNATLLRLATEVTPRVIFPDRRIGRLQDGYEASFLILDGNPIEDVANLERIWLGVKQGQLMSR